MAETTKFWMLVAAMCGVFAVAEYMYACEAIRVCRDRSRDTPYKILVTLILLVDCLGFIGCLSGDPMECYIRWCETADAHKCCCSLGNSATIKELSLSLLLVPFVWPLFGWVQGPLAAAFLIPELPCIAPYCAIPRSMIAAPLAAISLAAAPIRSIVMYQAPQRSWLKIIFVSYVTYWPVAFAFPYMYSR